MSLKEMVEIQQKYFKEYSHEIAVRNLKLMITVCYAGIIIFAAYYIVTFLFFPSEMISVTYVMIIPVFILFLIRIKYLLKQEKIEFRTSQILTMLMYIIVMGYAIIMSIIPHPDMQAVYYPLFLMLAPVMFILRPYQQFLVNGVSYIVFYFGVIHFKLQVCWKHDLFEGFTALIFSVVIILMMTQFRVQSDNLKEVYYRMSREDGLTGLLNKVTGTELAKSYIENKGIKKSFSMIILDIDDFKHVNDFYGHEKGDILLESVGHIMKSTFRKDDIVCRFGGDEFMILMKNISKADTEQKVMEFEKILKKLSAQQQIPVTCSMGIYTGICGTKTIREVLKHADDTLYEVKRQGKNSYQYYDNSKDYDNVDNSEDA